MEKVLIVDDEEQVVLSLSEFMSLKGYDVHTAMDGKAALQKVKDINPEVVLLDIIMPGMGGIEVLKEIKKINPNIGVIMATALTDEELARRTLELGAYDYIVKPFDLNYLERVVMVKILDFVDLRSESE